MNYSGLGSCSPTSLVYRPQNEVQAVSCETGSTDEQISTEVIDQPTFHLKLELGRLLGKNKEPQGVPFSLESDFAIQLSI